MKRLGVTLLAGMLAFAALLVSPSFAQSPAVSESALKSALFFKLPQFVYRSNESHDQPLAVCLLGSSTFGSAFEKLAQVPIDGRPVKYAKLGASADISRCDFLFVTQMDPPQVDALLRRLEGLPIVTVSDIAGFAKAGGMVEFSMGSVGAPVSILINRKAARQLNIEFNAQLLRLAKVVEP